MHNSAIRAMRVIKGAPERQIADIPALGEMVRRVSLGPCLG
jgi:hypothetical protein